MQAYVTFHVHIDLTPYTSSVTMCSRKHTIYGCGGHKEFFKTFCDKATGTYQTDVNGKRLRTGFTPWVDGVDMRVQVRWNCRPTCTRPFSFFRLFDH